MAALRSFLTIALIFSLGCASSRVTSRGESEQGPDLRSLFLAPLPAWAQSPGEEVAFLDMDRLIAEWQLSRSSAIELQAAMRFYLEESAERSIREAFFLAKGELERGKRLSGWAPVEALGFGEFVWVFPIDDLGRAPVELGRVVGAWVQKFKELPGCKGVVGVSALRSQEARAIVTRSKIPLDGVLTAEHQVVVSGQAAPLWDLRVLGSPAHSTGSPAIGVAPAGMRFLQRSAIRAWPDLKSEPLRSLTVEELASGLDRAYSRVYAQVETASRAANRLRIPLARAFFPYTAEGSEAYETFLVSPTSRLKALKIPFESTP